MAIALATGWAPDVVRDLTVADMDALGRAFAERARAMKGKR
jgi:hypothetical protein